MGAPGTGFVPGAGSDPDPSADLVEGAWSWPAMGGWLLVRVAAPPSLAAEMAEAAERTAHRVGRWADRLTRFQAHSELSALNARAADAATSVGPTLAAALDWAERASERCDGIVDVTLLDERLAAEEGVLLPGRRPSPAGARPPWWLERRPRGGLVHRRRPPVRFDLDGVAKGWIADRAAGLLRAFPAVLVDADGDISVRPRPDLGWVVGVADPRADDAPDLAELRLDRAAGDALGIATSGTSVHAWGSGRAPRHHLIDPRTGAPAVTDIAQATVVAATARLAEVVAKAIVIEGSDEGLRRAEEDDDVAAAIVLLQGGEVLATAGIEEWLA